MKIKIITLTLSFLVILLTEYKVESGPWLEFKRTYNFVFIEPLSYIALSVFVSSLVLLFFSDKIFKLWLKNIIYWYAPIALIMIVSGSDGASYAWPARTDFAILFGELLVAITLVFALVQKFWYKR